MKNFVLCAILFFSLQSSAQKLYPIEMKGRWGYMTADGEIAIKPRYQHADEFNEGYAMVAFYYLPCLIDVNEKRVIDTGLYQHISRFSEGLCAVLDYKKRRFYVNEKGEKVISLDKDFYDAQPFYNGLARVSKKIDVVQKKFGVDISNLGYMFAYINKKGELVTGFDFEDAEDMRDDVARVKIGGKFGLLSKNGQIVLASTYKSISAFSEGMAVVEQDEKYGYINLKGEMVIKPTFEFCYPFNEGLAAFEQDGKTGFIDPTGKTIIQPKFDEVRPFGEGMAAVRVGQKWGFIDTKGEWRMQPFYDDVAYFSNGICPVRLKSKWGAINKDGKLVMRLEFDFISPLSEGITEVLWHDLNLYADSTGNLLPKVQ